MPDINQLIAAVKPLVDRYREIAKQDGETISARCMVETIDLARLATAFKAVLETSEQ